MTTTCSLTLAMEFDLDIWRLEAGRRERVAAGGVTPIAIVIAVHGLSCGIQAAVAKDYAALVPPRPLRVKFDFKAQSKASMRSIIAGSCWRDTGAGLQ